MLQPSKKTKKTTTIENQVKFAFRLPAELYALLEQEATQNGRSINSQLIQILKERYEPRPEFHP